MLRCDLKRQRLGDSRTLRGFFIVNEVSLCICLTYFSQMPDYSDLLLLLWINI